MNKLILATFVALLMLSVSLQAQVKDQYQSDGLTTTVIKEDSANDMDILNSQFDMDDVGMHQVIRITTRQEVPTSKVLAKTASEPISTPITGQEPTSTLLEPPVFTASTSETPAILLEESTPIVVQDIEEEIIAEDITPIVVNTTNEEPQTIARSGSTTRNSSSVSSKRKNTSKTFKIFNKRFKKQKRKRVPRKRKRNNRCYRF